MVCKIITLGPKGTFSDSAAEIFRAELGPPAELVYRNSIKDAIRSIDNDHDYCVIPIENLSEGFIPSVLDLLVEMPLFIAWEYLLPIKFSFASSCPGLPAVERLYVQFVAKGQCSEFLDSLKNVEIIETDSNIESLHLMRKGKEGSGAIVPQGSFSPSDFPTVIPDVTDRKNNATRFVSLTRNSSACFFTDSGKYKTSILIDGSQDRPGLLQGVLSSFSTRNINLTSIVSRPTAVSFGQYRFYIDIDGHLKAPSVRDALDEIAQGYLMKWLGSYRKAEFGNCC